LLGQESIADPFGAWFLDRSSLGASIVVSPSSVGRPWERSGSERDAIVETA
jgi:hypothetical protein